MRRLVREGKKSDRVRRLAMWLCDDVAPKDWHGEILSIFDFVQNDIRYIRDPCDVEKIADADQVLEDGAGDCDDKTVLLAAMLESVGHPTTLMAIGFGDGYYSHVVALVWCECWLPLDATEDHAPGWLPPGIRQRMLISNGEQ